MGPNIATENLFARRRFPWAALACALIVAAGIAAYSSSFNGPFVFDDVDSIQDNSTIRHFPAWENFVPPTGVYRRPVVNLTLAVNYAIGGLDVRGFHVGNLFIHLLNALVLFGIVRRTLSLPGLAERFGPAASALALAVALLWMVHPLLTESVTYLTQRTELLMGLFFLLTLYGVIRGASSGHPWRWYGAAIAACALGMGAKEVMATAPIVVLLYDRSFLSGSFSEAFRRRLPFYLGLAATWAILGTLLIAFPWGEAGAGFGLGVGPWEYARAQPGVILNYLRLSFWPSSLCLDYGWPMVTSARQFLPPAAVIAALLAGTFWALCRRPALGFFGAWFFLILAPSSSFMPLVTEVAAERRMYLPLAAIVAGAVIAAYRVCERSLRHLTVSEEVRRRWGGGFAIGLLLAAAGALGCRTFLRNEDYRTPISIWEDATRKRPENPRAWTNLGLVRSNEGRQVQAIACFDEAIKLRPGYALAYYDRGNIHYSAGRLELALRDYDQAIKFRPEYARAWNNRATVFARLGRGDDALRDYGRTLALDPKNAVAWCNRALLYSDRKEYAKALADVRMFEKLGGHPDPDFVKSLIEAAGKR